MAFPLPPYTNGQTHTENGVSFVYNAARSAWDRAPAAPNFFQSTQSKQVDIRSFDLVYDGNDYPEPEVAVAARTDGTPLQWGDMCLFKYVDNGSVIATSLMVWTQYQDPNTFAIVDKWMPFALEDGVIEPPTTWLPVNASTVQEAALGVVEGTAYYASDLQKFRYVKGGVWQDMIPAPAGGTLTSVTAGNGLTGGTITTSGTVALNYGTANDLIAGVDTIKTYNAAEISAASVKSFGSTADNGKLVKVTTTGKIDPSLLPISSALVYRGNAQPTSAAPPISTVGDVYILDATGSFDASWGALAGQTGNTGDQLIYDGTDWNLVGASYGSVTGTQSIIGGGNLSVNRTLSLVNDNATPASNSYYGTDGTGIKGWHAMPTNLTTMVTSAAGGLDRQVAFFDGNGRAISGLAGFTISTAGQLSVPGAASVTNNLGVGGVSTFTGRADFGNGRTDRMLNVTPSNSTVDLFNSPNVIRIYSTQALTVNFTYTLLQSSNVKEITILASSSIGVAIGFAYNGSVGNVRWSNIAASGSTADGRLHMFKGIALPGAQMLMVYYGSYSV